MEGNRRLPVTRWAFPPPWLAAASASVALGLAARRAGSGCGPRHPPGTGDALLVLLERDLRCGHKQLAIRHFCMLRALGTEMPPGLERCCERLVLACAPARLARTLEAVHQWLTMLGRGKH